MPADTTLPQTSSKHHGNASKPYPCSTRDKPPGADWAINYGFCRTSLDYHGPGDPQGHGDPRCPRRCPHKASERIAIEFGKRYARDGAVAAAAWAAGQRATLDAIDGLIGEGAPAIMKVLALGNHTRADIQFLTGMSGGVVNDRLLMLINKRLVHICGQIDTGRGGAPAPIYAFGPGDKPMDPLSGKSPFERVS